MITVHGYCPMGCGHTLNLDEGGHVICSLIGCPNPTAVDEVLSDRETEHVVEFMSDRFTIKHPLRERFDADGDLWQCELHQILNDLPGPPVQLGRYRARQQPDGGWAWEPNPEG